jgi:PST family polysaccharide transporter
MNVLSLFVVGYVARKLGKADFGIFNFVTNFTMIFYPIGVLGLNRLTIRDLAIVEYPQVYAEKMLASRAVSGLFAVGLIIGIAAISEYPERTTNAINLAAIIFLFQLMTESLTDFFNAFQKMQYTALIAMLAGLTLQSLSIVVLFLGYGLFHLLCVYILGQIIGFSAAVYLTLQNHISIRLNFDWIFMRIRFFEGIQFFLMTMMWFAITRLDTVFLSKVVSMEQLGLYTSALLLVTKLLFIPHAVSSALLPALSKAYSTGNCQEISVVSGSFITKIFFVVLPCVITISFFSDTVISIVFGGKYNGASEYLEIGIWAFLFTCISFCEFSILTAVRKQQLLLKAYLISGVYCVGANLIMIRFFEMKGAIIAFTTTQILLFLLFSYYVRKTIQNIFEWKKIIKVLILNMVLIQLYICLYNQISWWLLIGFGILFYTFGLLALKLVYLKELKEFKNIFRLT